MSAAPKHPQALPVVRKFTTRHKIGFNPYLICWCGAELELNYFSRESETMTHKLNTFLDAHEDCKPKQAEEVTE